MSERRFPMLWGMLVLAGAIAGRGAEKGPSQTASDCGAWAQDALGWKYLNGLGVPRDYAQARDCYLRAATGQGFVHSQDGSGWIFLNGLGVAKNYTEAMRWYVMAASRATRIPRMDWAGCIRTGWVWRWTTLRRSADPKRPPKAILIPETCLEWVFQSISDGTRRCVAWAQNCLGVLYENGWRVEKNIPAASNGFANPRPRERLWRNNLVGPMRMAGLAKPTTPRPWRGIGSQRREAILMGKIIWDECK